MNSVIIAIIAIYTLELADASIIMIAQTPYVLPYVSCATIITYIIM